MDDPTEPSGGQSSTRPVDTSPPPSAPPAPAGPTDHSSGGSARPKRSVTRGPLFAVVALVLLVGSIFAGNAIFKRNKPLNTLPPTESPKASAQPTKSFRDATTGIAFDYPADWSELTSPTVGPSTKGIFGTGKGELVKLDVYTPFEEVPTADTIASRNVQDLLDKMTVGDNTDATITLKELQNINGTNTWHYVAQFRDPELGVGIHDVWFFFSGIKLEKLLFQAFPISDYDRKFKGEFNDIVRSYHTVPRSQGAAPVPSGPAPAPSK